MSRWLLLGILNVCFVTLAESQTPTLCGLAYCSTGQYCIPGISAFLYTCEYCPSETYCPDKYNKYNCPAGKTSFSQKTVCNDCTAGYYCTGGVSALPCGRGTYSGPGQSSCTLCGQGKYQDIEFQSNCLECEQGKYQDLQGQSVCQNCVEGKYTDLLGRTVCTNCAVGKYQPSGGTSYCFNCPVGQDTSGQNGQPRCYVCEKGKYSSQEGQANCSPCKVGQYAQNTGSSYCSQCNPGTYTVSEGTITCTLCPSGYASTSNIGSSSQSQACTACTAGTYEINDVCINCNQGSYSSAASSTCTSCGSTMTTLSAGSDSFDKCFCPSGGVDASASPRDCKECDSCTPGYYKPGTCAKNPGSSSSCQVCFSRYYVYVYTYTCKLWLIDLAMNLKGWIIIPALVFLSCMLHAACQDVPCGYHPDSMLPDCPIGTYCEEMSQLDVAMCYACKPGYYCPDTYGKLVTCPEGTYSTALGATNLLSCLACPSGKYGAMPGPTECGLCYVGAVNSSGGCSPCDSCSPGSYKPGVCLKTYASQAECQVCVFVLLQCCGVRDNSPTAPRVFLNRADASRMLLGSGSKS